MRISSPASNGDLLEARGSDGARIFFSQLKAKREMRVLSRSAGYRGRARAHYRERR